MAEALSLARLAEDLKQAGTPWEMDPETSMARLTEDERRVRLGVTPPPEEMSFEEAVQMSNTAQLVSPAEIAMDAAAAPAAYDLRNVNGKNFTTPVKDQGGCGSCVAFGTAAVLETTAKRTRNNPNLKIDLSEAHLFYCHAKEEGRNCANGWWPDKALAKAKTKGVTFDEYFKYTAADQNCALKSGWQNALAKPYSYTKLNTRAKMKEWISTKGSITGCFVVYQDFFSYRSGVYRHVSGDSAGGHCVEICGYNDAQGCWICKNSWGTNWGEGGYFRIAYGQCNIESWAGPYGVTGVSLRMWNRNTRASGLWANTGKRNAYVHLSGVGWRRVCASTVTVHHTMLSQLISAKGENRPIHALEENNELQEIYVL